MTDEAPEGGPGRAPHGANPQGRAVKLLQGYLWHPREEAIDFADYLPDRLEPEVHVLWDALPQAPFTFFDDGTLAATQQVYQFTVMTFAEPDEDLAGMVPWLAETLQRALETTPAGVGWQVFEDLRDVG